MRGTIIPSADKLLGATAQLLNTESLRAVVIRSRPGWQLIDFRELWRFRELQLLLILRDVRVRYKQTILGIAWVVLQPLITTGIFSLLFGQLANLGDHTGGLPYPLFVLSGLLAWNFFSSAVTYAAASVVSNRNLLTKVYFPRILLPLTGVGVSFVDTLVASSMLLALAAWYGVFPGPQILLLPLLVLLLALLAVGVGSLLAGLAGLYRDFIYAVPFGLQIWFYLTPVLYPADLVPGKWQWLWSLNPMAHLIHGFRYTLIGQGQPLAAGEFMAVLLVPLLCAAIGLLSFRRLERRLADLV